MTPEEHLIVKSLINNFPDFGELWEKYLEIEIEDEEDEEYITLYSTASEFSEYIINLFNKNETEKLSKAFSEIELMEKNGSEYIANVAFVGFIEGVLILRSHKGIPLNAFDEWLGENSKKFWYGMHDFFTKGSESEDN